MNADEVVHSCPLCAHGGTARTLTRGIGLQVRECSNCGFAYVSPRPAWSAMLKHYEGSYSRTEFCGQRCDTRAFDVNRRDIRRLACLIDLKRSSVLDIGCGPAFMLESAGKSGAQRLVGIEPGAEAAEFAKCSLPLATIVNLPYQAADQELADETFDLVIAMDIIEHVYDPRAFVHWIARRLKVGAVVFLKTPNWDAVRRYGEEWEGLWRDFEHVYYFNRETLSGLLAEAGLRVVEVAFEPYRAGLGGTTRIDPGSSQKSMLRIVRSALRSTPLVNRAAYASLERLRAIRSRRDIADGTTHGLIIAARRDE